MATSTVTMTDVKKMQREIAQLKKRVEKLEKKKTTRRKVGRKTFTRNGHRKPIVKAYEPTQPKLRTLRETREGDPLSKFIGAIDLGKPLGTENIQIDRDLAKEYGRSKE